MYTSKAGAEEGKQKTKVMLAFFAFGFLAAIFFFFFPVFMVSCLCVSGQSVCVGGLVRVFGWAELPLKC